MLCLCMHASVTMQINRGKRKTQQPRIVVFKVPPCHIAMAMSLSRVSLGCISPVLRPSA